MAIPSEMSPTLALDPLQSPGSDTHDQQQSPEGHNALGKLAHSVQDADPTFRQNHAAEPMTKTKRRMFSTPLLRRSATASSAAAASAASRIKSNLSTVTMLPTTLKRSCANTGSALSVPVAAGDNTNTDPASTVSSLSRSRTESSVTKVETKVAPSQGRLFGISSLMGLRTGSKDKTHSMPTPSPVYTASDSSLNSFNAKSERTRGTNSNNNSDVEANREDETLEATSQHYTSAISTASRFVMGMPTLLRRAVSNNHTPPSADAPAATQKRSPDTSANSTPRGEFPEDALEENDRLSLLMMLQVPEARNSEIPLMAASEAW